MLLMLGFTACGDNEDVWGEHILTDAEIAEMARQDSILEAQRNSINADLVLEYNVDLTIGMSYEGKRLDIDMDAICEKLGVTKEAFVHGFVSYWGYEYADAAELKFFAIEGSTHADNMGSPTAGSGWSHWWNGEGDVTTWANESAVYTEFSCEWDENDEPTTDMYFAVGQMPGFYTEPTTVKVIEAVRYQETRVAVVVNFNIKNPDVITGTVVAEKEMTINVGTSATDFISTTATFDTNEVISALGISSMSDATLIGIKSDGSYTDMSTANAGFWYNADGTVGTYGDAPFFVEWYGYSEDYPEDEYTFYVGTMPGVAQFFDSYPAKIGFLANGKIVMYNLNITVNTLSVAKELRPNETYGTVEFDHNTVMTALGITSMKEATLVNVNADGSLTEGNYTSGSGWWYAADGTIGTWPEVSYGIEYWWGSEDWPEDDYTIYLYTMGNLESGDSKTAHIGFKANDKVLYLDVTFNIIEPIVIKGEIVKTYDVAISFAASAEAYDGDVYTINKDEVLSALGVSSMEDLVAFTEDATASDGSGYSYAYTAEVGFWFKANGTIGSWGDKDPFFINYYAEDGTLSIGQYPGVCAAGDTFSTKFGLWASTNKMVIFNISITIK